MPQVSSYGGFLTYQVKSFGLPQEGMNLLDKQPDIILRVFSSAQSLSCVFIWTAVMGKAWHLIFLVIGRKNGGGLSGPSVASARPGLSGSCAASWGNTQAAHTHTHPPTPAHTHYTEVTFIQTELRGNTSWLDRKQGIGFKMHKNSPLIHFTRRDVCFGWIQVRSVTSPANV